MTGFEQGISGIGSDCSTNLATTTAHLLSGHNDDGHGLL